MRGLLGAAFEPNRRNVATAVSVASVLFFAYVVYPQPLVQYGAWLVVFTVWMVWFVYAGVDYVYGIESESG